MTTTHSIQSHGCKLSSSRCLILKVTMFSMMLIMMMDTPSCLSFTINHTTNNNHHHVYHYLKAISSRRTSLFRLKTSADDNNRNESTNSNQDEQEEENNEKRKKQTNIRFLGKGDRALVRPGSVLVAPKHEYSHWLMKSAIFIHAIGIDEYDECVIRGVIIDHPSAFTMGEMGNVCGTLAHNMLFRGGDVGNDSAILLHSYGHECTSFDNNDSNSSSYNKAKTETIQIECGDMIGTSGIYEGGLQSAMDYANEGLVDPERFKFFFNYVQFSEVELENILKEVDSDGDAWTSLEVPTEFILNNDFDKGDAWSYLRNQLKQMTAI